MNAPPDFLQKDIRLTVSGRIGNEVLSLPCFISLDMIAELGTKVVKFVEDRWMCEASTRCAEKFGAGRLAAGQGGRFFEWKADELPKRSS